MAASIEFCIPGSNLIIQRHDPPDNYEHRSSTAVFWINMHRLAIGDDAFTAEGFVSLAGDAVKRFS